MRRQYATKLKNGNPEGDFQRTKSAQAQTTETRQFYVVQPISLNARVAVLQTTSSVRVIYRQEKNNASAWRPPHVRG